MSDTCFAGVLQAQQRQLCDVVSGLRDLDIDYDVHLLVLRVTNDVEVEMRDLLGCLTKEEIIRRQT